MGFFTDVDQDTLIERHIRRLTGLEMEQGRKLLKVYVRARNRIKTRLAGTIKGTFTEAQLKGVLVQVDSAIKSLNKEVNGELLLGVQMSTEQSIEDLIKEVNKFEKKFAGITSPLPVDAIVTSLDPKNFLINQYQSSINRFNVELRNEIQRVLTQAIIERVPFDKVVNRISNEMATEEFKVLRIARTELHQIYNFSKISGMRELREELLPDLQKTLVHPMDARTALDSKELAKLNPVVNIDKPFKFKFRGQERVFMAPPDRPNDRAILVPFRASWDT